MEKFHTLRGQSRLSVYTQKKCGVRPRMRGRTLQIWRSTKGGSDPAVGAGDICVYTEGQKAGQTPHVGFDPAIGALCKRGISDLAGIL